MLPASRVKRRRHTSAFKIGFCLLAVRLGPVPHLSNHFSWNNSQSLRVSLPIKYLVSGLCRHREIFYGPNWNADELKQGFSWSFQTATLPSLTIQSMLFISSCHFLSFCSRPPDCRPTFQKCQYVLNALSMYANVCLSILQQPIHLVWLTPHVPFCLWQFLMTHFPNCRELAGQRS